MKHNILSSHILVLRTSAIKLVQCSQNPKKMLSFPVEVVIRNFRGDGKVSSTLIFQKIQPESR
jgi:hypothetical protein